MRDLVSTELPPRDQVFRSSLEGAPAPAVTAAGPVLMRALDRTVVGRLLRRRQRHVLVVRGQAPCEADRYVVGVGWDFRYVRVHAQAVQLSYVVLEVHRRGSTVRVRQRALRNSCKRHFSYRDDFAEFLACVGGDPLWSLQVQSPNPDSRLHSTSFCFRSRRRSGTPPTPASRRRVSRERGSRPRPSPPRVLRPPQLEPTERRRHRRSLR